MPYADFRLCATICMSLKRSYYVGSPTTGESIVAEQAKKAKKPEVSTAEFVAIVNKKGEKRNGNSKIATTRRRRRH